MTHFRDFTSSKEFPPKVRNVDSDAPAGMRQELIDLIFHIAEHNSDVLNDELIHRIICQCLGISASGQPYGGFRYAAGRDINKVDWPRVYDLICRIWPEFKKLGIKKIVTKPNEFIKKGPIIDYRNGVNRILSAYGVVWELSEEGRLQRYLPVQAQSLVEIAISQLAAPNFAPALALMNSARDAFDDRPRRDRDACTNIFDSMESIAKEIFKMPSATFGSVLKQIRQMNSLQSEITSVLESINTLRNRKFGHGMTTPFSLSSGEVDFTYLSCIGAIIMFANMI
jgi:hypothetical protein